MLRTQAGTPKEVPYPGTTSTPALRSITVHRFQPRWGWLGMAGDGWGWLGEGGDGGDGSFVTEITYGKFIN